MKTKGLRKEAGYVVAFVCLTIGISAIPYPAFAQTATNDSPDFRNLAYRFRPFLNFSSEGCGDQPKPCTWQWFVQRCDLHRRIVSGQNVIDVGVVIPNSILSTNPSALLTNVLDLSLTLESTDLRSTTNGDETLQLILTNDADKYGPDWTNAMAGDGIYAHVEQVKDNPDLICIGYIILFPYNIALCNTTCATIQWLREIFANEVTADHYGDLEFITLVYSRNCDKIIFASFSQHGLVALNYDLTSVYSDIPTTLNGYPARRMYLNNYFDWDKGFDVPDWVLGYAGHHNFHTECTDTNGYAMPQVYFVQESSTQAYDHIAVFLEWGSHDPWPAACGSDECMPNHDGRLINFLPAQVTYLGTMFDMVQTNYTNEAPFIFFNGKWGTDPGPAVLHNEWYYPDGRGNFANQYTVTGGLDIDPYITGCYGYADVLGDGRWMYSAFATNTYPRAIITGYVSWPPPSNTCTSAFVDEQLSTTATLTGPVYTNETPIYGTPIYVSETTSVGFTVTLSGGAPAHDTYTFYSVNPPGAPPPTDWLLFTNAFRLPPSNGVYEIDYFSVSPLQAVHQGSNVIYHTFHEGSQKSLRLTLDTHFPSTTVTLCDALGQPVVTCTNGPITYVSQNDLHAGFNVTPLDITLAPNFSTYWELYAYTSQSESNSLRGGSGFSYDMSCPIAGYPLLPGVLYQINYYTLYESNSVRIIEPTKSLQLMLDATPPVTATTLTGPTFTNGGITYVSGTTTIGFNVASNYPVSTCGAANTYYRVYPVGGVPPAFILFSNALAIPAPDGAYQIDYYSMDALTLETTNSVQLTLDTTPPAITLTQPTAGPYVHSATLTLNYGVSDGNGSGVQSVTPHMDGTTTLAGHGLASGQPINLLTELALGQHTFSVDAVDNLGNAGRTTVTFTIVVTAQSISNDVNQFVAAGKLTQASGTSLLSKLTAAAAARQAGDAVTARNIYQAFVNQVQALSGKKIDPTAAQILIEDAQYLVSPALRVRGNGLNTVGHTFLPDRS